LLCLLRHGAAEYSRSFLARRDKQYLEFFLHCISVEDKKPKKKGSKVLTSICLIDSLIISSILLAVLVPSRMIASIFRMVLNDPTKEIAMILTNDDPRKKNCDSG
jgi:hypothetical protein